MLLFYNINSVVAFSNLFLRSSLVPRLSQQKAYRWACWSLNAIYTKPVFFISTCFFVCAFPLVIIAACMLFHWTRTVLKERELLNSRKPPILYTFVHIS